MSNYFAIKQRSKTLWKSKFTKDQVLAKLNAMEISEDWLICRLGRADFHLTVREFIADPSAFSRQDNKEATRRRREKEIAAEIGTTKPLGLAQGLFTGWVFICLGVRGTTRVLDIDIPDRILIPVATSLLSLPIASVVLYLFGSIQEGRRVKRTAGREEADGLYD